MKKAYTIPEIEVLKLESDQSLAAIDPGELSDIKGGYDEGDL